MPPRCYNRPMHAAVDTWNIAGKEVLITGATDGIGKAAALALAKRNARVTIVSREEQKGQGVLAQLRRKSGNAEIGLIVCDLASREQILHAGKEFLSRHDSLHVLIHAAGVMPQEQKLSLDGVELTMAVNYFAPVLLTELLLPLIKKSTPARIINVTSSLYKRGSISLDDLEGGQDDRSAYANSKLALMLYTHVLASELAGSGVVVNAVHPGWIRTKLALSGTDDRGLLWRHLTSRINMRPAWFGAQSIVWLAADSRAGELNDAYVIKKRPAAVLPLARDAALARALTEKTRAILHPFVHTR